MNAQNQDLEELLTSTGLNTEPHPERMRAVETHVQRLARAARPRRSARRTVGLGALLFAGVATAGLAGTQTGRDFVRWLVVPVHKMELMQVSLPPDPSRPNEQTSVMIGRWSSGGDAQPFTPEEKADFEAKVAEVVQIQKAGGGRLIGLLEIPPAEGSTKPSTMFEIEYALSNGQTHTQSGSPLPQQRTHLRIDEIVKLRDSGAGQIVASKPSLVGMGQYTIRFALADGTTIDLQTAYPPGTGAERAAVFAETRQLKAARRFTVTQPHSRPDGKVSGILRYTLADGRQVGLVGDVPADMIGPDGKTVISTETVTQP